MSTHEFAFLSPALLSLELCRGSLGPAEGPTIANTKSHTEIGVHLPSNKPVDWASSFRLGFFSCGVGSLKMQLDLVHTQVEQSPTWLPQACPCRLVLTGT